MLGKRMRWVGALCLGLGILSLVLVFSGKGVESTARAEGGGKVDLLRVPNQGIQPQVAVDRKGIVHLIYFRGEPANGDIFYVRSADSGRTFSTPLQVNSKPESAIAVGNIRGAQLALGKNGRVHVAWNGSDKADPKKAWPMLYTRLNDRGTEFEPQRNVIQSAYGLDGGGSVAADDAGNVYVTWHAPPPSVKGEKSRCVWVASSTDEGKTFAREKAAWAEPTGACGCCGIRAFASSKGNVYLMYRSATELIHRDMYLLTSADHGTGFQGEKLHEWDTSECPMSSAAMAESSAGVLAAWETKGQVYWTTIDPVKDKWSAPIAAPGAANGRKHPVVASNAEGETILVWTEGMGWEKGGSLAWQVFDKSGQPTAEKGRADGVPVWSLVAVFARPDGGFTVMY
jgi:hypothetical protein